MNNFGFTYTDAVKGLIQALTAGMSLGFLFGFLRYLFVKSFESRNG